MKNIINITELLKGMCIIGLYYLLSNIYAIPFTFFINENNRGILTLFYSLLLTLTFVLIYIKSIIKDIKNFKKEYTSIAFNYWIKGLFIMVTSSFVINIFHLGISTNESVNRALINMYPVTEIISGILIAPVLEELVFRRSLKKFTSNIHIFAFTTGIFFGLIHIISSLNNPLNLLFLVPYSAMGVAFGYAYYKTNNIITTISIHAFHNALTILVLILVGGIL